MGATISLIIYIIYTLRHAYLHVFYLISLGERPYRNV